jgi:hypothetical protein
LYKSQTARKREAKTIYTIVVSKEI